MKLIAWAPPVLVVGAAAVVVEGRMISDATWAALIGGIPAIIGSIVTGIVLLRSNRAMKVETQAAVTEAKTTVIEAKGALEQNKESLVGMERQINSNIKREIDAAIARAIAEERLSVNIKAAEKLAADKVIFAEGVKEGEAKVQVQPAVQQSPTQTPAKPAGTTVNMEVKEMNVDELNAPAKPKA